MRGPPIVLREDRSAQAGRDHARTESSPLHRVVRTVSRMPRAEVPLMLAALVDPSQIKPEAESLHAVTNGYPVLRRRRP